MLVPRSPVGAQRKIIGHVPKPQQLVQHRQPARRNARSNAPGVAAPHCSASLPESGNSGLNQSDEIATHRVQL
ncbi:hypothetical protein GCM10009766_15940 [Microcella frigidaquae]